MSRRPARIRVDGESPYDVVVGSGLRGQVAGLLGRDVRRVAVLHPPALAAAAARLRDELTALDGGGSQPLEIHLITVPDAEAAKTAEVAARCWHALGGSGFTRSDAVVGLGGGSTTDLAGFVAATFLRGIAVVQVPTTLLAMVDAAVGGKTGINTAQGKNLVGSFHEPAGVVCDLAALRSLPAADLVSGLAEVVKCGFIADPAILDLVAAGAEPVADPGGPVLRELVERAIRVKARIVATDLRETTSTGGRVGRESLNYGHTLAHAIERVEGYTVRHGDAVAIGLVYAAELSRLAGRLDAETAARHGNLLAGLGLPTTYAADRWPELREAMRVDKKARGDRLRFVVLESVGRPAILEAPPEGLLAAAYAALTRAG